MMQGRRYSEGLHQALEAKEHVEIQPENQTLASITFQNYFRLYKKLAGMTGTASTEANEFLDIYGLDVLEIPTNVTVGRIDDDDEIYRTAKEKYAAIVQTIADCRRRNQPILVGTMSIEKSEQLSALLKDKKYIQELGRNALALADKLKDGKEGELKEYLADSGSYLVELGSRSRTTPTRCRIRCSMPATTSRKPASSPRPAFRAPSPSPPTWPAAAPTFSSAATSKRD